MHSFLRIYDSTYCELLNASIQFALMSSSETAYRYVNFPEMNSAYDGELKKNVMKLLLLYALNS